MSRAYPGRTSHVRCGATDEGRRCLLVAGHAARHCAAGPGGWHFFGEEAPPPPPPPPPLEPHVELALRAAFERKKAAELEASAAELERRAREARQGATGG